MNYLVCPFCGSTFFQIRGEEGMVIFKVDKNHSIHILQGENNEAEIAEIICCAACSWKGAVKDLLISGTA